MADADGFQPWFLTVRRLKHGGFTVGESGGDENRVLAGFDTLDGALAYIRKAMGPQSSGLTPLTQTDVMRGLAKALDEA